MKSSQILFITGTDTGVGKTVFTALATLYLRQLGFRVAALKPVASGGRSDGRILRAAAGQVLSLDEVNPWHFRAPIAPVLAAAQEHRKVQLREVVRQIRRVGKAFEVVVVEGAGGLLSPLGADFDSRDLIVALKATPIIVTANKLGAINQVRLVLDALPARLRPEARVVLVQQPRADKASRTNLQLLQHFIAPSRLRILPWIKS